MNNDYYYDFKVAPYALPDVCEALHWNGVHNACITKEDGDIHIRWKRDINRKYDYDEPIVAERVIDKVHELLNDLGIKETTRQEFARAMIDSGTLGNGLKRSSKCCGSEPNINEKD